MGRKTLPQQPGWIEERLELEPIKVALADRIMPRELSGGLGWFYTLGSATLTAFIILVVTGIMLTMNYSAATDHAWDSVQFINNEVSYGWLIRGLHQKAASAMAILIFLHALRVFVFGSYKYPRELTWAVGVMLLLLTMGSAFTGYLLPWDQKAYWATVVGTEIASRVPFAGTILAKAIRGGETLGAVTLTRFYSLHAMAIPALIGSLIGVHLFMVVRQGISAPPKKLRVGDRKGGGPP
ncbi:MAG: cytochrome b N-terminal domain-containing protein [Chloroflexi bacterium]|nr:cytochrome b N-terminal domain-containing protein [Chloroflexota bacterium]